MNSYAERARLECNSAEASPHPGGVNGRPFWNVYATQFMYVPVLQFPKGPEGCSYRYTAKDQADATYTFAADSSEASLAPIWGDLAEGFVDLKVEAVDASGSVVETVGERRFYKCAPFAGREAYPGKARSYRESALKAFRFVYEDPMVQYWLIHGVPQPDYPHNAYPSKMMESIVKAMVYYAKLEPSNAENALLLARKVADYLLSITPDGDDPLAGLPPTYSLDGMNVEAVDAVAPAAKKCLGTNMMLYPISAGIGFLTLYDATGDEKYFRAALRIGEFYKANVLPCGSWYLIYDCKTGKPIGENICIEHRMVDFFQALYEKTGDSCWQKLSVDHFRYIIDVCLQTYSWEGQFEDVDASSRYQNLTHFAANHTIRYIARNLSNDPEMVSEAVELMRFVEDQFVVWGKFPERSNMPKFERYYTPCGMEQYYCYWPIDASTATILNTFVEMYHLKNDRLYLEKALALADTITRVQVEETGMVPTFWMGENCWEGHRNFWINCQIHSAFCLMQLAELTESLGIE